jgi:hypothetical protein
LGWLYGSGFPKSHNLKGELAGFGTALKPAWEPIIMARKPLDGTVVANVLKWGTGAINVDGCRVEGVPPSVPQPSFNSPTGAVYGFKCGEGRSGVMSQASKGRWPANLLHDGSDEVMELFPQTGNGHWSYKPAKDGGIYQYGLKDMEDGGSDRTVASAARFFKCCPIDNECILCYNPSCKDITAEEICKHISAHHAEKNLATIRGIILSIVQDNALTERVKSLALNALSAENLCASCATNIALALVGIKHLDFNDGELQVILDSIGNCKSSILIQNLVSFAELWENIDTIPTTKSLSILFGSVNHAITNSIPATEKIGAKRFIYCPKASRSEREMGCEGMEERRRVYMATANGTGEPSMSREGQRFVSYTRNHHPTVKPLALMRYLCRLVTPPAGTILDPFMGSGTTLIAAEQEGFRAVGIELNEEYCEIARRRTSGTLPQ